MKRLIIILLITHIMHTLHGIDYYTLSDQILKSNLTNYNQGYSLT